MNLFSTPYGVINSDLMFVERPIEGFEYYPIDTFVGCITFKYGELFTRVCYSLDGINEISNANSVFIELSEIGEPTNTQNIYKPTCDSSYLFWISYNEDYGTFLKRVPYSKHGFNTEAFLSVEVPGSIEPLSKIFIINDSLYLFNSNTLYIYDKNTLSLISSTAITFYPVCYFNNKFYFMYFKIEFNTIEILESSDGISWNPSPVYTINFVVEQQTYSSCILNNNLFILIHYKDTSYESKKGLLKLNGTSWISLETNINSTFSTELINISCINSNKNVLILGTDTNVFGYSLDLGNTWNRVEISSPNYPNFIQIAKMFPGDFWTDFKNTTEYQ